MKEKVEITIVGCDDETKFYMELTKDEIALVERMCKLAQNISEYNCMPVIEIEEIEGV